MVELKSKFRSLLGTSKYLINCYRFVHNDLVMDSKKDLCIEGFPRSANTFSYFLIKEACNNKIKIAHHLHMSAQLKIAVALNKPAIFLIRNPIDAVSSFILREKGVHLSTALKWYNKFYQDLKEFKEDLTITPFENIIDKPESFVKLVVSQLSKNEDRIGWNKVDLHRIDELMKKNDLIHKKDNLILGSTRPNELKMQAKTKIINQIHSDKKIRSYLRNAETNYSFYL